MDEFQFINSIKQSSYAQPSLQKGIGDDAAVFRTSSEDIVTAVDTFVENIHFSDKTMDAFHIGYRALAANISDMAAMGAQPKFYLVSIVIPKGKSDLFIQEIFQGMGELARKYQMDLIGGDTVSGKELTISVTILGFVPKNKVRYRSLANKNDIVFVTGTLGDSIAGLHILKNNIEIKDKDYFIKRHRMPEPRVNFALALKGLKRIAFNDISDGIANELQEIAVASDVDIIINDSHIPTHPGFRQFTKNNQNNWKYFGGEDFELVGTAPERDWNMIQQKALALGVNISKIGTVKTKQTKQAQVFLYKNNEIKPLLNKGYTHLK